MPYRLTDVKMKPGCQTYWSWVTHALLPKALRSLNGYTLGRPAVCFQGNKDGFALIGCMLVARCWVELISWLPLNDRRKKGW